MIAFSHRRKVRSLHDPSRPYLGRIRSILAPSGRVGILPTAIPCCIVQVRQGTRLGLFLLHSVQHAPDPRRTRAHAPGSDGTSSYNCTDSLFCQNLQSEKERDGVSKSRTRRLFVLNQMQRSDWSKPLATCTITSPRDAEGVGRAAGGQAAMVPLPRSFPLLPPAEKRHRRMLAAFRD